MWGTDILGPLPKAPGAIKYLLVTINYFTKWIEARPLREIVANEVEKFTLKHLICRYDLPYTIVTDNDTQFKVETYENFLRRLGIKHLVTSVEHPQTNG